MSSFTSDFKQGAVDFIQREVRKFKDSDLAALNVFRYWTSYIVSKILTGAPHGFQLEADEGGVAILCHGMAAEEVRKNRIPFLCYKVMNPTPSRLVFLMDTSPSPDSLSEMTQELITHVLLFRLHIFIFSNEGGSGYDQVWLWNQKCFLLDSSSLYDIAAWVNLLYTKFDYHYITNSHFLFSLEFDSFQIFSTGPIQEPSSLSLVFPVYVNATIISWEEMFHQLLMNLALVKGGVCLIYPDGFFFQYPIYKTAYETFQKGPSISVTKSIGIATPLLKKTDLPFTKGNRFNKGAL